jgi:putative peptidoglycan lipid II flippase
MSEPSALAPRGSDRVAAGILASRLVGLVRERIIAYHLGGGLGAEAFRVALRIPNLLQNLLGEGVISAAFVPTYARLVDEGREEEAGRLAGAVATVLVLVTGTLVLVGVLLAGPLTRLLAPGFVPGTARFELTVTLVRIVTPGLGLLVLSAWCLGVLTAHRRLFLPYVAPVLWNAAIIIAVSVAAAAGRGESDRAAALAVGATVGAVLQFAVQLPSVVRLVGRLGVRGWRRAPGLAAVLRASVGAILGRGVVQLSAYLDLILASLAAAGAVAALGYAQVLYLLPVSLFGMSVAIAALPDLAIGARRSSDEVRERVAAALGRSAFFVVPTVLAYLVAGEHVVATLFRTGRFDAALGRQVSIVLGAYALGLAATTGSRLLQSALYGADDTVTPARIAGVRVAVSSAVGLALMLVLDGLALVDGAVVRVAGIGLADAAARSAPDTLLRLGAVGLALGASLGAWIELALLRRRLVASLGGPLGSGRHLRPVLAAAAIALPAGIVGERAVDLLVVPALLAAPVALAPPALVYLVAAHRLGVPEAGAIVRRLAAILRRRG